MEVSVIVALTVGGLTVLLFSWWKFQQLLLHNSGGARIPAGSFGWPIIGETLSFANCDPLDFANPRISKYGPVFKSHLAGVPSIIVTTPDMAKFVYSERSSFRASYPSTIATLVGKKSLSNCDPARHLFLKKSVQSSLFPESLRREVGRVERFVVDELHSWVGRTVLTAVETKELTLNLSILFVFGLADIRGSADARILVDTYQALAKAFYAIPINLPGFTWYKALKSRERGCVYLRTLIAKSRKDSAEGKVCNSVLRALVDARDEEGNKSSDEEIIDVLIGTFFGGHDTIATSLTWIIKFLSENPGILKSVVTEQDKILKSKAPGEPLTWEDTRQMVHTSQVIQETLRNPTILQFTARVATKDVEYKDFLVPKGWRVFIMTTCLHLDAANYPEPAVFDPSRFKVAPKFGTYFPFAGGAHMCPGNELAKLVMFVFVHHLTTKFRWETLLPATATEFRPFPLPVGGYPINIFPKDDQ